MEKNLEKLSLEDLQNVSGGAGKSQAACEEECRKKCNGSAPLSSCIYWCKING